MKTLPGTLRVMAALAAALSLARGATIVQWSFNSPVPDADSSTGTRNPSSGNGTASYAGGVTNASSGEFAAGDTHSDPAGSSDNSAWSTSKYPALAAANKSAGVRFDADTTGYENITLGWSQRNSATASRYWQVQYTLDGNNFSDASGIAVYVDSVFTNKTVNLSAIPGAANNPAFGFRIVAEWENSATGGGANAYVATDSASAYNASSGTVRLDMVTISGTVIPGSNTPPAISSLSNQTIRVSQSTGPLAFTVLDAEDPASSLTLAKASSDPTVIPLAGITFGGVGSSRSVNIAAGVQSGFSTITVRAIDTGGKSNSTAFTVTVLPANTSPFISAIAPTNTLINLATAPIPFAVADLETSPGGLAVSGSSANPSLLPNANIVFGGSGSNRTVTLTPAAGQTGVAPLTVSVSDGTNTASSGFALMVVPSPAVIFHDPFNYAGGSLLTNSGFLWENRSGTFGQCQVTNGQLLVTSNQTEDVLGPLIGGPYAKSNGTVMYAAFRVKFLTLPKSNPGLFAHFATGSTLRGRLYAGVTNAAPGSFRLQVANGSDTTTELPADLELNTTYTLVTRYNLDAATTTLWLNPASESDPGVTATDPQSAVSISSYGFRQDADIGASILIDDLTAGLSFDAVISDAAVSPIPLTIERSGNNVILRWTNSAFALQSAPAAGGTFTNVPAATNPFTNPITGPPKFFRLKL